MNDYMITCIKNYIFKSIRNDEIMQQSQNMKTRRGQLNTLTLSVTKKN